MIDDLIDRLNGLCRKLVTGGDLLTDGNEIRKVFTEVKGLGYRVYPEPFNRETVVLSGLSEEGVSVFVRLQECTRRKLEAIGNRDYERAADLRDRERDLEQAVKLHCLRAEGGAWFRIKDREAKEVSCYLYCEMLPAYFRICSDS